MKRVRSLVISAALFVLGMATTKAVTFEYSYVFPTGDVISGTFSGTPGDPFVTDVSNITLAVNGSPVSGTIYSARFDPSNSTWLSNALVSPTPALNNFIFSNVDVLGSGDLGAATFLVLGPSGNSTQAIFFSPTLTTFQSPAVQFPSTGPNPSGWNLSEKSDSGIPSPVPDGSSAVFLLGSVLAAIGFARRFARRA